MGLSQKEPILHQFISLKLELAYDKQRAVAKKQSYSNYKPAKDRTKMLTYLDSLRCFLCTVYFTLTLF